VCNSATHFAQFDYSISVAPIVATLVLSWFRAMEFEWNEEKADLNERKHGVPFPFATRVFLDENRLEWIDTRRRYGEPRWITIGLIEGIEIVVTYTLRGKTIRLISARKAVRHEREDYWKG
jgi:uncharacterized DUF497 family protein